MKSESELDVAELEAHIERLGAECRVRDDRIAVLQAERKLYDIEMRRIIATLEARLATIAAGKES